MDGMVAANAGLPLLIRADASAQIGAGHVMRCLALAEAWQDRSGQALFITACKSDSLRQRLVQEGFGLIPLERAHPDPADWETTSAVLEAHPGAWMVLDGYHFDSSYQRRVREAGHPLLVIDDMAHLEHYWADVVLNQNLHAETLQYSAEPNTQFLLGTRYVLLRREFRAWRDWKRETHEIARKVLVTMGGSDPDNVTLKVVRALAAVGVDDLEAVVVVGAANPHYEALHAATCALPYAIRLLRNAPNMPELIAWADLAVSAAGSTCWELAFMGLPAIVLVLADNQRPVADGLAVAGAAFNLGLPTMLTTGELGQQLTRFATAFHDRASMQHRAQELVDGEGVGRVVDALQGRELKLRPMRQQDCRLLWKWANDPEVRAAAFSSRAIPWEDHVRWFNSRLQDPACRILVALDGAGTPVGQVRFDMHSDEAEIDVSLERQFRGCRYGRLLIAEAVRKLFRSTGIRVIHAHIKHQNARSIAAFEEAGFERVGMEEIKGSQAVHCVRVRDNE
jgi:UDP-2,4-diacetamido-2,4,6-trideoxy-beta-L-altropyranose hydrolase